MNYHKLINERIWFNRLFSLLIGIILLDSCKENNRDLNQPEDKIDSVIEKFDSIADTVGHQLKDLNEGVEGGYEKLRDGTDSI